METDFTGISSKPSKIEGCSDVRRSNIKVALGQGKSFEELREMFRQAEEAHLTETFLKNGSSMRCILFDHNFGSAASSGRRSKSKNTFADSTTVTPSPNKQERGRHGDQKASEGGRNQKGGHERDLTKVRELPFRESE